MLAWSPEDKLHDELWRIGPMFMQYDSSVASIDPFRPPSGWRCTARARHRRGARGTRAGLAALPATMPLPAGLLRRRPVLQRGVPAGAEDSRHRGIGVQIQASDLMRRLPDLLLGAAALFFENARGRRSRPVIASMATYAGKPALAVSARTIMC